MEHQLPGRKRRVQVELEAAFLHQEKVLPVVVHLAAVSAPDPRAPKGGLGMRTINWEGAFHARPSRLRDVRPIHPMLACMLIGPVGSVMGRAAAFKEKPAETIDLVGPAIDDQRKPDPFESHELVVRFRHARRRDSVVASTPSAAALPRASFTAANRSMPSIISVGLSPDFCSDQPVADELFEGRAGVERMAGRSRACRELVEAGGGRVLSSKRWTTAASGGLSDRYGATRLATSARTEEIVKPILRGRMSKTAMNPSVCPSALTGWTMQQTAAVPSDSGST
jgi:hypothetical protein